MKGGRNSRVSMTSPRILRSESCLGKDPLEGSPQRGASETTHLSQVPGEGRGAEGSKTHRLRSSGAQTPAARPWRRFALTSEPEDQSASAPRRLARKRLANEWRGGPQKLEEQVTMDAVALSNHGSGKPLPDPGGEKGEGQPQGDGLVMPVTSCAGLVAPLKLRVLARPHINSCSLSGRSPMMLLSSSLVVSPSFLTLRKRLEAFPLS